RTNASFVVSSDYLTVKNSSIFGLSTARNTSISLAKFSGSNSEILGNVIIDINNNHKTAVEFFRLNNSNVEANVARSFSHTIYGTLYFNLSEQVVIQHNVLADGNSSRIRNLTPQPDPQ